MQRPLERFPITRGGIALIVLCAAFATSEIRAAADSSPSVTIESVRVGFDGAYKVGQTAPLEIVVTTSRPFTGRVDTESTDPDGYRAILPMDGFTLPSAGTHRLSAVFRSGRLEGDLLVNIVDQNGQTVASKRLRITSRPPFQLQPGLRQSMMLCALLGKPAGFDWAGQQKSRDQDSDPAVHIVRLDTSDDLPELPEGLECLDVLVMAGQFAVDEARSAAIKEWVQCGGHLMLAIGSKVDAYKQSGIASWMPLPIEDVLTISDRDLSAIESYAGRRGRITSGGQIRIAKLGRSDDFVRENELVVGRAGPLIVRIPFGFGRITVLAVDLDSPPLSNWPPVEDLTRRLLIDVPSSAGVKESQTVGRLSHSGITDLASQLNATLDYFPSVRQYSSWMVMGLMALFILLVGPLDYLLVHHVLKKPRLTWITLPIFVLLTTGVTLRAAWKTKGSELQTNQLDVVDVDAASQFLRAHTWTTIYSPESLRYAISGKLLPPFSQRADIDDNEAEDAGAPWIGWEGIPENGFGGIYRPGGFEMGSTSYSFAPLATAIENLPISTWSSEGLKVRWNHVSTPLVESRLASLPGGGLSGNFTHHFPVPLDNWIIAYGSRVYRPARKSEGGGIPPDEEWSPDTRDVEARELKGFLTRMTRRRVQKKREEQLVGDILEARAPYDASNRDPEELIRMLTFHEAAGGKSYTGLNNEVLRTLDYSQMLDLGRAVLFAKIDTSAANILIDGAERQPTQHSAFVRIILPVATGYDADEMRTLPKFSE